MLLCSDAVVSEWFLGAVPLQIFEQVIVARIAATIFTLRTNPSKVGKQCVRLSWLWSRS